MTNDEYLKDFKAQVEGFDDFDACVLGKFQKTKCQKYEKTGEDTTESELKACQDIVKEEVPTQDRQSSLWWFKSTLTQNMSM